MFKSLFGGNIWTNKRDKGMQSLEDRNYADAERYFQEALTAKRGLGVDDDEVGGIQSGDLPGGLLLGVDPGGVVAAEIQNARGFQN